MPDKLPSSDSGRTGSHHGPGPTVARPAEQPTSLPRIGRFELRAVLGEGAFGRVYRAFDPNLDREVALKVPVPDSLRTPADRDRFLKEARSAATVSHPNVCQIHEVGEHEGQPYIVMALVPGHSLAEMIRTRKEPLPQKQAAIIIRKLAMALEAAHKKGVVHRDLKPANVMFDKERKDIVVMDFGLARRSVVGEVRDTQSGVVMGTPAYMSPEQAKGDSKDVGPAGDIFSLGIIMYELLTGERPFTGSVYEVISQILLSDPMPPSSCREGIDPLLEAACLKALEKDPRKRFASMKEFAASVDAYLHRPETDSAESSTPVVLKTDVDDGAGTDTRKLAEVFDAISENRKKAKAETEEAVAKAAARHGVPRWAVYLGLGLLGLMLLGGAVFAVYSLTKKKEDAPSNNTPVVVNNTVRVKIQLPGIDLADKTYSYTLDGKPRSAEELGQEIEMTVGEHEIVVTAGEKVVKRFKFKVTGGDEPVTEEVPEAKAPEDGFVSIFNGKNLEGWESASRPAAFAVDPSGNLTVAGDTGQGGMHWLLTKKQYTNYVLRLEFLFVKPAAHTFTAVAPRSALDRDIATRSMRLKVPLRNNADGPLRTGAMVYTNNDAKEASPAVGTLAVGAWHTLELDVRGAIIKVTINGKLVNDVDLTKIDRTVLAKTERWADAELDRRKGHIGLLSWKSPAKFKNIRVKDLSAPVVPPVGASDEFKGLELVKELPHKSGLAGAVFAPNGGTVLTALHAEHDNGEGVSVWDIKAGKPVGGAVRVVRVARVAGGGAKVVLGQNAGGGLPGDRQAEIVVWDAAKNGPVTTFAFDGKPGRFSSLDLAPDGKSVVASRYTDSSQDTAVFDLATGEFRMNRVDGYVSCFVPDKDRTAPTILVGYKDELRQIEVATGKVKRTLKKHTGPIQCVACAPGGRFAVSSAPDTGHQLVLWDLAADDGNPVVLGQSKAPINAMALAPNGRFLVSGSAEGVLKMWDVVERKEVFSIRADEKWVTSVAFSPDGTQVVTAGWTGAAKVWKLTK